AVFGTDYNNYDHKLTKVFGEQNTVIGVGNLVGYTAEKDPSDPTKWIYTKNSSGSDQNVAVGMTNTANGGSVVVGTSSEAENLGVSFGHGNKVIGSNSGGGQRGLALGNYLTVKGEEAVAVGTNASATADWAIAMGKNSKAEKETAMAFGYDSHAKVSGGVALGSWSVVDTAAGVSGYDPSTKAASTDTSAAWKSTVGAVSVGDASKGITRQITGVAAGAADTDAVNVAQLKKVEATAAAAKTNVTAGDNVTVTHDSTTNTYKVSAKDTYTTGGTYDAATKKIKFTQNDPSKNYEVDVSGLVGSGGTGSLTFAGDTGSAITKNSGETLQITGGATEVAAANNIGVVSENGKLNLKLAKNIDLGSDGSIKTGDTKMDNKGLAIQGGPSVTKGGIDAGSKKITHVAAGEISATSTDAVNGSQLQAVKNDVQNNTQNIYNMGKKVGELGTRINKVGAGAAALAALHPLDFDPHDKWDIAAGFGNYRNASAAAVGLFYRPNERTMMSLGWTMGDDRNMINAGVSVKLGRGDVYTRYSKVEMANQIKDLKEKNDKMQAENKEMRSELNELKAQVAALAAKK
ncbi:YadA-like family protein, partial [Dialister invisus]